MARLISVNVGLPRDIAWKGRTVHTAIWKDPVRGRCRVQRTNLDGDRQGDLGGHGGEQRAVYVYQIESYRYWQEQRTGNDFVYGQFGENFTIEGLPDDEVCIGDQYRIGDAVRGNAAARHVLSPRHSDERAAHARNAHVLRAAGILPPRSGARRRGRRRCHREGGTGRRADDRRRDQRAALLVRSSTRSTGARVADRRAFTWMARVIRRAHAHPNRRRQWERWAHARGRRVPGCTGISAARGGGHGSRVRGRRVAHAAEYRWAAAECRAAWPVRGPAPSTHRRQATLS